MTDDGGEEPSRWWPQAERLADAAYPQQIESALKRAFAQGQADTRVERDALVERVEILAGGLDERCTRFDRLQAELTETKRELAKSKENATYWWNRCNRANEGRPEDD